MTVACTKLIGDGWRLLKLIEVTCQSGKGSGARRQRACDRGAAGGNDVIGWSCCLRAAHPSTARVFAIRAHRHHSCSQHEIEACIRVDPIVNRRIDEK